MYLAFVLEFNNVYSVWAQRWNPIVESHSKTAPRYRFEPSPTALQ
jgi:hypothetical protein